MPVWVQFVFILAAWKGAQSQMQLVESGGAVRNEGESIRLSCKCTGFTCSSSDMFWYRQSPGESPEFVSRIYYDGTGINYAPRVQGRFTISRDNAKSELYLAMSRLRREDTARYHCAVRVYWVIYYEKLIFGSGTKVTVEPKNPGTSSPSVFVVKSTQPKQSDGQKLTAACLAKDFYPKSIEVNMNPETDLVYKSKEGILSSNGKYSMIQVVKVDPNEEVECIVNHDGKSFTEKHTLPASISAPINNTQVCESSNSTFEEPNMEKVNMLSVTVLGLRVLLAKSIAFNMLMTVKLFIF